MTYDHWKTTDPSDALLGDPPLVEVACDMCGGEGHTLRGIRVYEAGCGFAHDDVEAVRCENCNGTGSFLCEADSDDR